jgi:excisionase family DNA binding protein
MPQSESILIGLQTITTYLKISKPTFYKLVKNSKLPAIVIDGTWYAHKDNLDDYFKAITRAPMHVVPEDAQ